MGGCTNLGHNIFTSKMSFKDLKQCTEVKISFICGQNDCPKLYLKYLFPYASMLCRVFKGHFKAFCFLLKVSSSLFYFSKSINNKYMKLSGINLQYMKPKTDLQNFDISF